MSSKIVRSDDLRPVTPMTFRQVQRSGGGDDAGSTSESRERFAAQIAHLEQQCEQRIQDSHAAGVREGETAGRSRAAAEIQPVIDRLARTIDELSRLRAGLRKEAEADVVKLSLAIARRILRRELAVDPEALRGLVVAALEKLQGQELCRVKVHPSHAAMVKSALQQTVSGNTIDVIPDASREPGTVIFETQRGNLDASVDSQLREIERGLADCLRKRA
jgi:flagellar assembly protein FliH